MHRRMAVAQSADFVLEVEFLAFEFRQSRIVHGWVVNGTLQLSLERAMFAFEFGEMILQRHFCTSCSIL